MIKMREFKELKPYRVLDLPVDVKLDANEVMTQMSTTVEMDLSTYPDNESKELIDGLCAYTKLSKDQVLVGNGSNDLLDLIIKAYIGPGDRVLGFEKTFSMYKSLTATYGGEYVGVKNDYVMDMDQIISQVRLSSPKIIVLCNPNNPTGYLIPKVEIERLLKNFKGLVLVDEAYIEFSGASMINRLDQYPNLLILRTLSKAWSLAGARVGYMLACPSIIKDLRTLQPPYNLNALSQQVAIAALKRESDMRDRVKEVIRLRERVFDDLKSKGVGVYKSYGNFLYFKGPRGLGNFMRDKKLAIRMFDDDYYRVTIGNEEEMNQFIFLMKEWLS